MTSLCEMASQREMICKLVPCGRAWKRVEHAGPATRGISQEAEVQREAKRLRRWRKHTRSATLNSETWPESSTASTPRAHTNEGSNGRVPVNGDQATKRRHYSPILVQCNAFLHPDTLSGISVGDFCKLDPKWLIFRLLRRRRAESLPHLAGVVLYLVSGQRMGK